MRVFTGSRDSIERRTGCKQLIRKWTEAREKVQPDIILAALGTDKDVIDLRAKPV